jgi:hypothetical protein
MATYYDETELKAIVYDYILNHNMWNTIDDFLKYNDMTLTNQDRFKELYRDIVNKIVDYLPPMI